MLNIVIPMAGRGSRFSNAGYLTPKPLIPINGTPMIELVVNNLRPAQPHRFIFICQQEHIDEYGLNSKLNQIAPGCLVVGLPGVTAGAACSVLYAAEHIDNDQPLMIANSDQWVDVNINDYLDVMEQQDLDGLVMTMPSTDPKWSYAKLNENGWISSIVEKEVISKEATVGIYNFRRGRDFCQHAREMILRDERSQGEFYIAPIYTMLSRNGSGRIYPYNIGDGMYGLGTPQDLCAFLQSHALHKALHRASLSSDL